MVMEMVSLSLFFDKTICRHIFLMCTEKTYKSINNPVDKRIAISRFIVFLDDV